jgi:hypothetical protein
MKIKVDYWEYECGEPGCCYDWGYNLVIDGVKDELTDFSSEADALWFVLTDILGHERDDGNEV